MCEKAFKLEPFLLSSGEQVRQVTVLASEDWLAIRNHNGQCFAEARLVGGRLEMRLWADPTRATPTHEAVIG